MMCRGRKAAHSIISIEATVNRGGREPMCHDGYRLYGVQTARSRESPQRTGTFEAAHRDCSSTGTEYPGGGSRPCGTLCSLKSDVPSSMIHADSSLGGTLWTESSRGCYRSTNAGM